MDIECHDHDYYILITNVILSKKSKKKLLNNSNIIYISMIFSFGLVLIIIISFLSDYY